ncbi:MAG: PhnD/SsuA/transferrin family substrate-binding protein [Bryobacterales bacterium]|nr:PhnD/SsuA/transferrin family substrate-binding protein [Bryobacterales bacterium]
MDVSANDARSAMVNRVNHRSRNWNITVECTPRGCDTTQEILNRLRNGQLDAVALNVVEYRQMAHQLDAGEVVVSGGAAGPEQYVVLVQDKSGIQKLGALPGHRLIVLAARRMCVAAAWLSTLLEEGRHVELERYFSSVTTDTRVSRTVLPVFFGKADACPTRQEFDTMSELNPQVARDLKAVAQSSPMVVAFYVFRKGYQSVHRESLLKALSGLNNTASGRQLATLFQFEDAVVKDGACLTSALAVLETSERARGRQAAGSRKG